MQGKEMAGLARKVGRRERFLRDVIEFSGKLTNEKGKECGDRQVHSAHCQSTTKLDDFLGFSFEVFGSLSVMGGTNLKIWYNPRKKDSRKVLVLDVNWWHIEEPKVQQFDDSIGWQRALQGLMHSPEKTEARYAQETERRAKRAEREKVALERRASREARTKKKIHNLRVSADRLGIS